MKADQVQRMLKETFYAALYQIANGLTDQSNWGIVSVDQLAFFLAEFTLKTWREKVRKGNPQIIIFSGPTGVGKTTILHEFEGRFEIRRFPNVFTREVRPDDRPGDFVSMGEEEFRTRMARGEFLQVNQRHGYWHGVLKQDFFAAVHEGKRFYMDKSVPSTCDLLSKLPEDVRNRVLTIYVLPPNFETLWDRISRRSEKTPSEDKIERLLTSFREFSEGGEMYDLMMVNDDVSRSLEFLGRIL